MSLTLSLTVDQARTIEVPDTYAIKLDCGITQKNMIVGLTGWTPEVEPN